MRSTPRKVLLAAAILLVTWCRPSLAGAAGIRITAPPQGSHVNPGQVVSVTVEPLEDTHVVRVLIGIPPLTHVPPVIDRPPYQLLVQVPSDRVGTLTIAAVAADAVGNLFEDSVNVVVLSSVPVNAIRVRPDRLVFPGAQTYPLSVGVVASFGDSITADVTKSPDTTYTMTNAKVAAVNSNGQVQALAPGLSTLTVTYGGFTVGVPVSVAVYALKGDLNGDGIVDQDDLDILLKALNTPSSGPRDPRDLNNDGVINALDARILTTLCSRPGCAKE